MFLNIVIRPFEPAVSICSIYNSKERVNMRPASSPLKDLHDSDKTI